MSGFLSESESDARLRVSAMEEMKEDMASIANDLHKFCDGTESIKVVKVANCCERMLQLNQLRYIFMSRHAYFLACYAGGYPGLERLAEELRCVAISICDQAAKDFTIILSWLPSEQSILEVIDQSGDTEGPAKDYFSRMEEETILSKRNMSLKMRLLRLIKSRKI